MQPHAFGLNFSQKYVSLQKICNLVNGFTASHIGTTFDQSLDNVPAEQRCSSSHLENFDQSLDNVLAERLCSSSHLVMTSTKVWTLMQLT